MKKIFLILISLIIIPSVDALTLGSIDTGFTYNNGNKLNYYYSRNYKFPIISLTPINNYDNTIEVVPLDEPIEKDRYIEDMYLNFITYERDAASNYNMGYILDKIYSYMSKDYYSDDDFSSDLEPDNLPQYIFNIDKNKNTLIDYFKFPFSNIRCQKNEYFKLTDTYTGIEVVSDIVGEYESICIDDTNNTFRYFTDGENTFITLDNDINLPFKLKLNVLDHENYYNVYNFSIDNISFDSLSYKKGEVVKYSLNIPDGMEANKIIIKDYDNNEIPVNDNSFIMPSSDVFIYVELKNKEDVSLIDGSNEKSVSAKEIPTESIKETVTNYEKPVISIIPLSNTPNVNISNTKDKDNDSKEIISTPLAEVASAKTINKDSDIDVNSKKIFYIGLFMICIIFSTFIVKKVLNKR